MSAPLTDVGAMPGDGRSAALVVGTAALSVVYAVLVPLHLLILDGDARWVMSALATLSCAICAGIWWSATHQRPGTPSQTGLLLLVMCAVPLVNSLVRIAVTAMLEQTTVMMLAILGVAAVHDRARQVLGLVAAACATWAVVVVTIEPRPVSQTGLYAIQVALACVLGVGIFLIRSAMTRRLVATSDELARQLSESDRLRIEARISGNRFESVFTHSPVAMALGDENGVLVEVNQELCTFLGRPMHEVVGRPFVEFMHPGEGASLAEADDEIRSAPDGVASAEKRYVRASGEVRWGGVTFRHLPGPQGQTYTLAHIVDITDRKADEEKLRQSQEVMRAMVDISRASLQGLDPREPALAKLTSLTRAMAVSILERSDDGQLCVTAATDPTLLGARVDLDEPSATAHAWRTAQPLFVSETLTHPLVNRRLLKLTNASSMMWEPVISGEDVVAMLAVSWDVNVEKVSDFELEAVAAIAAETAIALTAERMRRQLETATVTDPLTGLLNRRGWDAALAQMSAQARRTGSPFTIALIDLDHFKLYNDAHGHLRGDEALREFSAAARLAVRDTDLVARWGGEEFVVALRDTSSDDATSVIQRLHLAPPEGVTCSIGYAEVAPGQDVGQVIKTADVALFAAKRSGRNRSVDAPSALTP